MDSKRNKGVSLTDGDNGQGDMKKFENILEDTILEDHGREFFKSPKREHDKRFLELIFGKPQNYLFYMLKNKGIRPNVLKMYLEKNKKNIKKILNNNNFIYECVKKYVDNMVSTFEVIEDTQGASKIVQQNGMRDFESTTADNSSQNTINTIEQQQIEQQQTNLKSQFESFNAIYNDISNSTEVSYAQIVVQKLIISLIIETYRNTSVFQSLMAQQLDLAKKLQEENKELLKDKADAAVAKADVENLKAQLEDAKNKVNNLQKENEELLEVKTNAAVAETALKGKEEVVALQKTLLDAKITEINSQNQKLKEQEAVLIERERRLKEAEENLKEQEKKLNEANANTGKANTSINKANSNIKVLNDKLEQYETVIKELVAKNAKLENENKLSKKGRNQYQRQ